MRRKQRDTPVRAQSGGTTKKVENIDKLEMIYDYDTTREKLQSQLNDINRLIKEGERIIQ